MSVRSSEGDEPEGREKERRQHHGGAGGGKSREMIIFLLTLSLGTIVISLALTRFPPLVAFFLFSSHTMLNISHLFVIVVVVYVCVSAPLLQSI